MNMEELRALVGKLVTIRYSLNFFFAALKPETLAEYQDGRQPKLDYENFWQSSKSGFWWAAHDPFTAMLLDTWRTNERMYCVVLHPDYGVGIIANTIMLSCTERVIIHEAKL